MYFPKGLSRSYSSVDVRLLAEGKIASTQVLRNCQDTGQADQITRTTQENSEAKVGTWLLGKEFIYTSLKLCSADSLG